MIFSVIKKMDLAFPCALPDGGRILFRGAAYDRTVSGKLDRNIISLIRGRRGRVISLSRLGISDHLFTLIKTNILLTSGGTPSAVFMN